MRWMLRVVVVSALAVMSIGGSAQAAAGGGAASGWHIGYYAPSGNALSFASAPSAGTAGIANLAFTNQPNTALLVTDQPAQWGSLLGDLTGKTLSASFTISGLNAGATFSYYEEPTCGGTTSYVRYFFETSNAGGFAYTHYWWSNPVSAPLTGNGGPVALTSVPLDPSAWSDWNGQFGTTDPAAFAAAVSNVTMIGLSFGGGCFFENGVGTSDGSGTFTLNTYTAS